VAAPQRLTSAKSDRVTAVRTLHGRQGRRKAGRFVVEGPQSVRSALSAGVVVHDLFMDDDAGAVFPDIVESAEALGVPVTWSSAPALAAMAETPHPQGVLAVCGLLSAAGLDAVMAAGGPVVVLDGVTDPGNVGTVIRTADAVGAAGVVLTPGSADVHNGKVVRSTAGSLFHLPILSGLAIEVVTEAAARHGRTVVVATGDAPVDLFQAVDDGQVDVRTCWIVGSEAHGVSEAARSGAHLAVRIPMTGRAESLNAAVAAAVVLYVTAHASHGSGDSDRGAPG
jgi:RNA methyltransferase, TrmH family